MQHSLRLFKNVASNVTVLSSRARGWADQIFDCIAGSKSIHIIFPSPDAGVEAKWTAIACLSKPRCTKNAHSCRLLWITHDSTGKRFGPFQCLHDQCRVGRQRNKHDVCHRHRSCDIYCRIDKLSFKLDPSRERVGGLHAESLGQDLTCPRALSEQTSNNAWSSMMNVLHVKFPGRALRYDRREC